MKKTHGKKRKNPEVTDEKLVSSESPPKINWNQEDESKASYKGITRAYLALKLAVEGKNIAPLEKMLSQEDVEIDWNKGPVNDEHKDTGSTVASLAIKLALKGNPIALRKMLSDTKAQINWSLSPQNEQNPAADLADFILGDDDQVNPDLEYWANQLTGLSLPNLHALKSALTLELLRGNNNNVSLLFHYIHLVQEIKFPSQKASGQIESLDDEKSASVSVLVIDKYLGEIESSPVLHSAICYHLAENFPSSAEKYYGNIPTDSGYYPKVQYKKAMRYHNLAAEEKDSEERECLLKKAFETGLKGWFYQKSLEPSDLGSLIENITNHILLHPETTMSGKIELPITFLDELKSFKRASIKTNIALELKINSLWLSLYETKSQLKIQKEMGQLKEELGNMNNNIQQLTQKNLELMMQLKSSIQFVTQDGTVEKEQKRNPRFF